MVHIPFEWSLEDDDFPNFPGMAGYDGDVSVPWEGNSCGTNIGSFSIMAATTPLKPVERLQNWMIKIGLQKKTSYFA